MKRLYSSYQQQQPEEKTTDLTDVIVDLAILDAKRLKLENLKKQLVGDHLDKFRLFASGDNEFVIEYCLPPKIYASGSEGTDNGEGKVEGKRFHTSSVLVSDTVPGYTIRVSTTRTKTNSDAGPIIIRPKKSDIAEMDLKIRLLGLFPCAKFDWVRAFEVLDKCNFRLCVDGMKNHLTKLYTCAKQEPKTQNPEPHDFAFFELDECENNIGAFVWYMYLFGWCYINGTLAEEIATILFDQVGIVPVFESMLPLVHTFDSIKLSYKERQIYVTPFSTFLKRIWMRMIEIHFGVGTNRPIEQNLSEELHQLFDNFESIDKQNLIKL
jgi:hypothetical protein